MLEIDLRDRLSVKERDAFASRQKRLSGAFGHSAGEAMDALNAVGSPPGVLVVRNVFSYLKLPVNETLVSDRRAPHRSLRPSATRISTSQGVALRLYLTALAVSQAHTRPGKRARPDLTLGKAGLSWADLVATKAETHCRGTVMINYRDKKKLSVRNALKTLQNAKLVDLPGHADSRNSSEAPVIFLHEAGQQQKGDSAPYQVPQPHDLEHFLLPSEFITNGWIHVLEDSEITLLLMARCGLGRLMPGADQTDILPGEVAIPGGVRLCHYGIHRDPYTRALKSLRWFGLLEVREVNRHPSDGRAVDSDLQLHRLKPLREGFERPAIPHVLRVIGDRLGR